MTIWVVLENEPFSNRAWSDQEPHFVGAYSTKEKAEAAVKRFEEADSYFVYKVLETELDK